MWHVNKLYIITYMFEFITHVHACLIILYQCSCIFALIMEFETLYDNMRFLIQSPEKLEKLRLKYVALCEATERFNEDFDSINVLNIVCDITVICINMFTLMVMINGDVQYDSGIFIASYVDYTIFNILQILILFYYSCHLHTKVLCILYLS